MLITAIISIIVGVCFGFLICGIVSVNREDEVITESKIRIKRQSETIASQSLIIASHMAHIDELESKMKMQKQRIDILLEEIETLKLERNNEDDLK